MSNPITQLKLWYTRQNAKKRTEFKHNVINECGIDESTFYRYLSNEAPKLTKHLISSLSGISTNELYKTI